MWLANTTSIEDLIQQFETTFLTEQEAIYLENFKNEVRDLQQIQKQVLTYSRSNNKQDAQILHKAQNQRQFQRLLAPLHDLITLQEQVGHELYLSADRKVKSMKVISYMVIAMAVTIALISGVLLQSNRRIIIKELQKYHLN